MEHDLQVPVIGGLTTVNLTSAGTLASLGVSVSPLGSATIGVTGANPIGNFTITGGTQDNGADGAVILHQGSGLELSNATGVVGLEDFRVDTINSLIAANVTVNGVSAGNVAVFSIGADAALTLTETAAGVVGQTLGTTAITPAVQVGIADVAPVLSPDTIGLDYAKWSFIDDDDDALGTAMRFSPIIDGETEINLTSAATLASLDITVNPIGSATIETEDGQTIAEFDITGGTSDAASDTAVILHQGSGLELAGSAGTLRLSDFLVDTQNNTVGANVAVNGVSAGNVAVFDIGTNGALTLTLTAADVVGATLGTQAITSSTVIGFANPDPVTLPAEYALLASMKPLNAGSSEMFLSHA